MKLILADAHQTGTVVGQWLLGSGTALIAGLIGGMWRAWAHRLARQDAALVKTNEALAVLLAEHGRVMTDISVQGAKVNELEVATAVLAARINELHPKSLRPDQ